MLQSELVPAVAVSGLSKTYAGGLTALRNIDLTINRGEIFALLGPNGAGKTTLINIICGIVTATAGCSARHRTPRFAKECSATCHCGTRRTTR